MWNGMLQGRSVNSGHLMQPHKHLNEIRIHPTQKPEQLYKWILEHYAEIGNKILDTHMGSQSSRIAAHNMGFDYYGWEISEKYFTDGCKRFLEQTAQIGLYPSMFL